jgi:hypothetical protein
LSKLTIQDRQYIGSVDRERNPGPATTQQYKIDSRYWCEKSLDSLF